MSQIIFPGDTLPLQPQSLGPGLYQNPLTQEIIPTNAGLLTTTQSATYTKYNNKRYIPAVGDYVIGTVVGAFSDSYKVSLCNFTQGVSLSYMAFPNASKKNKPNLKNGDLVYARVLSAERELEAEIECMDSSNGQNLGFGLLQDGCIIDVPMLFCHNLLFNTNYPFLRLLSKKCEFEIAIGVNGKIWLKTNDIQSNLACYRALQQCSRDKPENFDSIIKQQFKLLSQKLDQ